MDDRGRLLNTSDAARADLRDVVNFYESQSPDLGKRFLGVYIAAVDAVVERPTSFPVYYNGVRRVLLDPFPVGLFFREVADEIQLLAIMDLRRNPRRLR